MLLCLWSAIIPTFAAQNAGLTIHYAQNGDPLVNAPFSLYLVAWEGADGQLIVAEDFAKYNINITNDPSKWPALASTLAAYAAFGQIHPVRQGRTDYEGLLRFSGLSHGIYLVVGNLHRQNGFAYTAEPALISLSGKHLDIFPKAEWVPDGGGDGFDEETIKVLKVWDDGNAEDRPQTITVHLLQDGQICDTIELHSDNRWSHVWNNLPAGHEYTVVEDLVGGYTVSIRRQGITFVVTNTTTKEPPIPDQPEDRPDAIPETGQPWAYVLMLAAAGLLFLVIGLSIRRGENHEA